MDHPLDDCRLIAARATAQFDALQDDVVEFFKEDEATVIVQKHRQTGHNLFDVTRKGTTFPRDWGIRLGEIANSARSALDQMVYALSFEGGGQPEREKTAFPIFEREGDYWRKRRRRGEATTVRDIYLAGVDDFWKEVIDERQPYHAGDNAYREPLAILAHVNNANKHRLQKAPNLVIETPAHFIGFSGSSPVSEIRIGWMPGTPDVDVDAKHTGTRAMDNPGSWIAPKVQVDDRVSVELIFGEPPRIFDLFDVKAFIQATDDLLTEVQPAFDP